VKERSAGFAPVMQDLHVKTGAGFDLNYIMLIITICCQVIHAWHWACSNMIESKKSLGGS
jgi:hypothetical protein